MREHIDHPMPTRSASLHEWIRRRAPVSLMWHFARVPVALAARARALRAPIASLIALLPILLIGKALGAEPDQNHLQIDSLIERIETSDCRFNRNGVEYSGKQAAEHLRKKRVIAERVAGKLLTPELFIKHVASSSGMTGTPYLIECAGQSRPLGEWLRETLAQLRTHRDSD